MQVPERRRCDLSKLPRRSSGSRYGGWQGRDNGQLSFSSTRPPFGRSNSTRKFRTNSNIQNEASGHRNSIFTPQDARSDLPEVPEVPETPKDDNHGISKIKQKRKGSHAPFNNEHPITELRSVLALTASDTYITNINGTAHQTLRAQSLKSLPEKQYRLILTLMTF